MGGLDGRVKRLEERHDPERREPPEEERKRRWLATARARRGDDTDRGEWQARDIIRLLKMQGRLPKTTEELRDRLLAWRPPLDPRAAERALARAIFEQEEGTEAMVCPPALREAFVAARELRARYEAVADEVLARWSIWQHELAEGGGDDLEERLALEADEYGITEGLMLAAIGPDAEEIGDEEATRRLREILADLLYGEKGYRVEQHITRLMNEERSSA